MGVESHDGGGLMVSWDWVLWVSRIFLRCWGHVVGMPDSEGDTSPDESAERPFEVVDVDVSREQRRKLEAMFTCHCPWGHDQPDEYSITAIYRAQNESIEVDSFKEWMDSFEEETMSGEAIAAEVYSALRAEFGRSNAEVILYQQTEVGVTQTIEVGSCA